MYLGSYEFICGADEAASPFVSAYRESPHSITIENFLFIINRFTCFYSGRYNAPAGRYSNHSNYAFSCGVYV